MAGFNFEKNLEHQTNAVESVLKVFRFTGAKPSDDKTTANISNPVIKIDKARYMGNIKAVQAQNNIDQKLCNPSSKVIDVSMETGTGKTYTYTKMMFELNKNLGMIKFVIIVPTLSIKAGTVNFLRAEATKEHFRQEYKREIKIHVVESVKGSKKNKKSYMPQAVKEFVEASSFGGKTIHALIINAGMINSDTMNKAFDVNLFDRYNTPFGAIAAVKPFAIIDEPHKFGKENKTWENIKKFESQYIVRYGATFDDKYENLVYRLSAVDAFNGDLVKGVATYIEKFSNDQNSVVMLKEINDNEAVFELDDGKKHTHKLAAKESMGKVHHEMNGLVIEKMNKTTVLLSNGLEMKKGDKLNPYSFAESIQDKMMNEAVKRHFELEKKYLTREVKIKPLTLFFINDIEGYRDGHNIAGSLKTKFEALVQTYAKKALKNETNEFYKSYLEKTLKDLSLTHGGYFSKDNFESDEKIEKEIEEILHDKETLLSLDNPRRFIFSKWTLREGWDNPNVFQICKLRSSGSVTSKLQEVGRGLRLPVNEYMSRVKDEKFDLHYYVDFAEKDFAQSLIDEINKNSGTVFVVAPTRLTEQMIKAITKTYPITEDELLEALDEVGAIKRNNDFKEGGYEKLKSMYPSAVSDALKSGKVRDGNAKIKATMRVGKYEELKHLWEAINQKVVLEYKIENEEKFFELLCTYFLQNKSKFKGQGIATYKKTLEIKDGMAFYVEEQSLEDEILPIVTMSYKEFLVELATQISVNINALHKVFLAVKKELDINQYRNIQTVRAVKGGFNKFLLDNSIDEFSVSYTKISNTLHPTKFTDENANALCEINASDLGVQYSVEPTAKEFLFEELFFDSELEKENIKNSISEVIVFTKIPKNSIRIPVAGGGTYSPDFAYIVKRNDGAQALNLIVETKDRQKRALFKDEEQKIKHAEILFNSLAGDIKVEFKTQFEDEKIVDILKAVLK